MAASETLGDPRAQKARTEIASPFLPGGRSPVSPGSTAPDEAVRVSGQDLPSLRGWQKAAYAEYFNAAKRDFLLVATPGAGKTTYALTIARELLTRREVRAVTIVTPTEHLKYQWAQAAKRFNIAIDPSYRNAQGRAGADFHGVAVTYAQVAAHRHGEVPIASDCYSTKYECACKHQVVAFLRLVDIVRENLTHKATLDLPEEVVSVLDAWCDVDSLSYKQTAGGLTVSMRLTVSMFAKMEDGRCLYFDQSTELSQEVAVDVLGEVSFEPTADVASSSYNLVGREKMELRCELVISGCVYSTLKQSAIADVTVDAQKEKVRDAGKLIIYYSDPGESVWDIAKHYNTSANAIWDENAVEQDILPDKRMLLIPIV